MPGTIPISPANSGTCVSCGAEVSGPYCSRCGERALEPEALTLRHFLVHTVAHEVLHVDGTLWQTLRLLFVRPGRLSLEYAAGRRRPFVNPFRLLLIAIVAYVLITAASGFGVTLHFGPVTVSMTPPSIQRGRDIEDVFKQVDGYGLLQGQVAAKQQELAATKRDLTDERVRQRFHDRLGAFVQPASFTNVFLLAATLHLAFRRRRRRFLEHAAFSMHFFSFVLLSSLTAWVAVRLRGWLGAYLFLFFLLVSLWQFAYLAVAIRRFYLAAGGWMNRVLSVAAALLIYLLNTAFITGVQIAGAAIALAML